MKPSQSTLTFCLGSLLCCIVAGCGLHKSRVIDQQLLRQNAADDRALVGKAYVVRSPDVIEVQVPGSPRWSGRFVISNDGRLQLPSGEAILAEGLTPPQIARELCERTGADCHGIRVNVVEHKSQQLFVYGEVKGETRVVAYHGPETILSLLQRMGGLSRGAAPSDVQIVRAHVAEGRTPETFQVDLESILVDRDTRQIPRVQPFDQIYVGQSQKSCLEKSLPRWLRPLYVRLAGLHRRKEIEDSSPILKRRLDAAGKRR